MVGILILYYLPYWGEVPGTNLEIPGLNFIRTDIGESGSDWDSILFRCAVFVLIAIGLNVVVGLAGLLDLGYVGFFAIGAYSVALFGSQFTVPYGTIFAASVVAVVPIGILVFVFRRSVVSGLTAGAVKC